MSQTSRFCTNCGRALQAGVRFCGQCGAPVQPAPADPAQPPSATPQPPAYAAPRPPDGPASAATAPQAPAEPILAAIPGLQRRKGFLGIGVETMNMVVTPQRLIVAMVSQQMMKEAVAAARDQAKGEGKNWLGQVAAQMGWMQLICRQYASMHPDAILAQYPGSFAIPNASVSRIRFKESSMDDDGSTTAAQMILETTGGKHRFEMTGTGPREARQILRQILPHAIR